MAAQGLRLLGTAAEQAFRLLACAVETMDEPDHAPDRPAAKLDPERVEKEKTAEILRRRGLL